MKNNNSNPKGTKNKNNKNMKTQIKNIIAAAFLFAATSLNANTGTGERSIKVSTENSKAVVLELDNMQPGTDILIKG